MSRRKFDETEIVRLNGLDSFSTLALLGLDWRTDASFKPRQALGTSRVHVTVGAGVFELLVNGPKWFNTRSRNGGAGAISLAMHLHHVNFVAAVTLLNRGSKNQDGCRSNLSLEKRRVLMV